MRHRNKQIVAMARDVAHGIAARHSGSVTQASKRLQSRIQKRITSLKQVWGPLNEDLGLESTKCAKRTSQYLRFMAVNIEFHEVHSRDTRRLNHQIERVSGCSVCVLQLSAVYRVQRLLPIERPT